MRFASTRHVSGLLGEPIHSASARRRPEDFASGSGSGNFTGAEASTAGTAGATSGPLFCRLPRPSRYVGGTFALVAYLVLTMLFMLVDTIPLIVKFFSKPGPYDTLLDREEVKFDGERKAFLFNNIVDG